MSSKKLLVKVFLPGDTGQITAADLDKVLDRIHKNERMLDYDCTLSSPSQPATGSSTSCYSKTAASNTDNTMPTIVVDLYVNTGESPAEIQQIVEVVYEAVNQTLVLDRNMQGKIGLQLVNYSPNYQ